MRKSSSPHFTSLIKCSHHGMLHWAAPDNRLVLIFQKVPYGDYLKARRSVTRIDVTIFISEEGPVLITQDLGGY